MYNHFFLLLLLLLHCMCVVSDLKLLQALGKGNVRLTSSSFICHVKFYYKRKIALFKHFCMHPHCNVQPPNAQIMQSLALFIEEREKKQDCAVNESTMVRYCVYVSLH